LDGFADHCFNFDNVMGLEAWHLQRLKRVKVSATYTSRVGEGIQRGKGEGRGGGGSGVPPR
jgi:hypothetical protein